MRAAISVMVLAAALVVLALPQECSALTGREVMEKADKANRAADEVFESTMHIVSARGIRRERRFQTNLKAGEGDDDKILVRFLMPPDIRGTGLLTLEEGEGDTQWLYLPDLRKTKRISGSSKAGRFMGSDLSHYDMRTENLPGHAYELLGEETVSGRPCYKVEAKPKNDEVAEETGYGRRLIFVDSERWLPIRVEYFDRELRPLKVLETSDWHRTDGLWRSSRVSVENSQEDTKTLLEHDEETRRINAGIDDATFTKRVLEQP